MHRTTVPIDDGISLLRRAVELEPDAARQAELWFQIGHASALKYDGQGMVEAMTRALELGADPALIYPELAYQWALRTGMWQNPLDGSLSDGWIERGLAESADQSPARVKALLAKSMAAEDVEAARTALAISNQLGDTKLRLVAAKPKETTGDLAESLRASLAAAKGKKVA